MAEDSTVSDVGTRLERAARIFSLMAIPLVLAVGGWVIQTRLTADQLQREYVAIAISVLTDPDVTYPPLHFWAVDVLAQNSPTPMADSLVTQLKKGVVTLSTGSTTALVVRDSLARPSSAAQSGWLTVLGTFGIAQLAEARNRARDLKQLMRTSGESPGGVPPVRIYRTQISNSYAVTLGGASDRAAAIRQATRVRELGWVPDAFAQADRGWAVVDSVIQ